MTDFPIGIIDSGVGGLSIWQDIVSLLPHESTIYIADQNHLPYGEKTEKQLFTYGKALIRFLHKQQVKLVVLACNTLTVSCLDELRLTFPDLPIVGTVPVVKTAAERTSTGTLAVLSTIRTAESEYQHKLIEQFAKDCRVLNLGTNDLVPLIEVGMSKSPELIRILQTVLEPLPEREVDTLALGCTHYAFIKKQIMEVVGQKVTLLDSGPAVARQVQRILEANHQLSSPHGFKHELFTTGERQDFEPVVRILLPLAALDSSRVSFASAVI